MMKRLTSMLCILLAAVLLCSTALAAESLSRGDRGIWVMALQLRLNQLGYSVGEADGDFGGKTASALEQFQKDRGLSVTGAADEATWAALYDEYVTLENGGLSCDVKLTAPFTTIETNADNGGSAVMSLIDITAIVVPVKASSLEGAVQQITELFNQAFESAASQVQATNNVVTSETFDVAGQAAAVVANRFDFVNGGPLTHYAWLGVIPVDESTMLRVEIGFNVGAETKSYYETLFTNDTVKDIFAGIRLAGAKAAGGYEPVGDANISDLLPLILKYVDNDASYTPEITDGTRVNMYYAAKAMSWFYRMTAAGNDRKDVLREAELEIIVSAMDKDLRAQYSVLGEKFINMITSLVNYPEEDTKAALATMGITDLTWTDEDLVDMMETCSYALLTAS